MLQSSPYNAWHGIRIQPTVTTFIFAFASIDTYRYSMSFIVKFFKEKMSPPRRYYGGSEKWALNGPWEALGMF